MDNVNITINGKKISVQPGTSVLQAALSANIYIPHLCFHPDLKPIGSCGICLVEADGKVQKSCTLIAEEGMVVSTGSEKALEQRNLAMQLIMAAHPEDCATCVKYGNCELQTLIQFIGVSPEKMRRRVKKLPVIKDNPLFDHDMVRCVLCGRCVRVCREVRGIGTLDYHRKNDEAYVGVPAGELLVDEDCRFCGACAEVCPTGAISDKKELINLNKVRTEALVPCRSACPAGTNIPEYLRLVKQGEYGKASAVIREKLPFPKTLGRVCHGFCEDDCRREMVNRSISIKHIKLLAVEKDTENAWKLQRKLMPATGKKVAVVGAGPAGLTAAYYLQKQGHEVMVFEKMPLPGGMATYGIPEYRLPLAVVEEEVQSICEIGVSIACNSKIESIGTLAGQYDAVVLAMGADKGHKLRIPGNDLPETYAATDFLRRIRLGEIKNIDGRVFVVGGGNVAFDCARSAVRLGASEVRMACLEDEKTIPGDREEVEAAIAEGLSLSYSKSFVRVAGEQFVEGIETIDVESLTRDAEGRMVINTIADSNCVIPCEMVVFAVGQMPDLSEEGLQTGRGNLVMVDEHQQASIKNVFAAGDVVSGTCSIVQAVASGRSCAQKVDLFLGGDGNIEESLTDLNEPSQTIGRIAGFGRIGRVEPAMEHTETCMCPSQIELNTGFASEEASRCLQCDLRLKLRKTRTWNRVGE